MTEQPAQQTPRSTERGNERPLWRACRTPTGLASVAALLVAACATLKSITPIAGADPHEYELAMAGRLDAHFVGTESCLKSCHAHDKLRYDFDASTMGVQLSRDSGLPVVDCESCHGPGSLAVESLAQTDTPGEGGQLPGMDEDGLGLDATRPEGGPGMPGAEASAGPRCDFSTFVPVQELAAGARSLICLKCHGGNSTFSLHEWTGSVHVTEDVACSDCHKIHAGPDLTPRREDLITMCNDCHQDALADASLPSRHPLHEGKVVCTDCHDPHGTSAPHMLREATVAATCNRCHADKHGPYGFEHADLVDDCMACHRPHGSPNDGLLVASEPYLCLQCHAGHWLETTTGPTSVASKAALFGRCTDCHGAVHGSDVPSAHRGSALLR